MQPTTEPTVGSQSAGKDKENILTKEEEKIYNYSNKWRDSQQRE
jgi:hypothetical protein